MPPKRKRQVTTETKDETDGAVMAKAVKKPRAAPKKKAGPWKMPPPIPVGEIFTDLCKKQWKIGGSVGKGGFGEIYLAAPVGEKSTNSPHVIKVEPHENGPLFTELSFYRRAAQSDAIDTWIKTSKLSYLPIPKYISSGSHEKGSVMYRFMVMEGFGEDIEKLFCNAGRRFGMKTVCYLALRVLEGLEYLHQSEYVHADIKGSNLLTGYGTANKHKVYLVDYGLAYRYLPDGEHRAYKADPRRSHDGTIEFTSIDAHDGANPSRRGDLEILGYCLLQWASGHLPWISYLEDKPKVTAIKKRYKYDLNGLLSECFADEPIPVSLQRYMDNVYTLEYQDKPDYMKLKQLFLNELKENGWKDDKEGLDWLDGSKGSSRSTAVKKRKRVIANESPDTKEDENGIEDVDVSPIKRKRVVSLKKGVKIKSPRKTRKDEERNDSFSPRRSKRLASTESPSPKAPVKTTSTRKKAIGTSPKQKKRVAPRKQTTASNETETEDKECSEDIPNLSPGNELATEVSTSTKIPKAVYPSELGYISNEEVLTAETFGSVAEKKRNKVQKKT